jgi:hypothetical protein
MKASQAWSTVVSEVTYTDFLKAFFGTFWHFFLKGFDGVSMSR